MRFRQPAFLAVSFVLLAISAPVFGGKVPLRPDELVAESELIVVGQVQSHRDEERAHDDGSKSKLVFLTVRVESVDKGTDIVGPGDTIHVGLWVVIKEPSRGILWDSGHWGIPGDGGRAKFFLESRSNEIWNVIYPNGFERLDDTPPLHYPMAPADRFNWPIWIGIGITAFLVLATLTWLLRTRRYRRLEMQP